MKEENKLSKQAVSKSALIEATFKKFEWLLEHFNPREIHKVSFRQFTYNLLERNCEFEPYKPGHGEFLVNVASVPAHLAKKILFFSKEGKFIGQVGVKDFLFPEEKRIRRKLFGGKIEVIIPAYTKKILFQETVSETLKRLDSEHNVYYIVGLIDGDLIITKPLDGRASIHESLKKELADAEIFINQQLA